MPPPSPIPDWNYSGINTNERYSAYTWSPSKARPRLVIPNWLNEAACSRHMEATEHLKKMKSGNVLIRCTHTHTHTHSFFSVLVGIELLSYKIQGTTFLNTGVETAVEGGSEGCLAVKSHFTPGNKYIT